MGLAIGIMVILGIGLTLAGPVIVRTFSKPLLTPECSYHLTVVTYVDRNENGVRDEAEPGLAGVKISVQAGSQAHRGEVTDDTGLVQIERYAYVCEQGLEDQVMVSLAPPPGYTPSPMQFGPFPVTDYPHEPPLHIIHAGFQRQ
jgi:hypothetical protein